MEYRAGGGEHGGRVIAGAVEDIMKVKESLTDNPQSERLSITGSLRKERKRQAGSRLSVRRNNLEKFDVKIPLGVMTCVTVCQVREKFMINEILLYKKLAKG